ncbi:MAG: glutamate--cysteine ligase [Chloroflexota bacterium]
MVTKLLSNNRLPFTSFQPVQGKKLIKQINEQIHKLDLVGSSAVLRGGLKGLEKESLRASVQGDLSQTAHPKSLGSALTHSQITTDYSEALLELVTSPHTDPAAALAELDLIHRYVYANINNELMWAASMPCIIHGETKIPIAKYGSSNVAKMKETYRMGLGHRYGRVMQAISGIHFNYSLPENLWAAWQKAEESELSETNFRSEKYMGLVRNYLRWDWLTLYLFGSSPAICKSFFSEMPERNFPELDSGTVYEPYGTSLRMSDIGYQNKAGFAVSRNSVNEYADSLENAVFAPHSEFSKIGVEVDGNWKQLSGNILQIANEFYSAIRPKMPTRSGERPTVALRERGVAYVEVRSIDVNPSEPLGMNPSQLRFLEALLITAALADSPPISDEEQEMISQNQIAVARTGRKPELRLNSTNGPIPLGSWARDILDAMYPVCVVLDQNEPTRPYTAALYEQRQKIRNPELTPSAKMLSEMNFFGESFFTHAMRKSLIHQQYFLDRPLPDEIDHSFKQKAVESLGKQTEIEAADNISFEDYLQKYFKKV